VAVEATTRWSRGVAAPGRPWSKVRAVHAICVLFWPCDIALHLGTSKKRGGGPQQSRTVEHNRTGVPPRECGGPAAAHAHAANHWPPSPTPGNTWHGSDAVSNTKHERCRNPASDSLRIPRRRPTLDESGRALPPPLPFSSPRPHPLFSHRPGCSTERDLRHA
jgi:hypothetical protein